jgi:hypothetical protein
MRASWRAVGLARDRQGWFHDVGIVQVGKRFMALKCSDVRTGICSGSMFCPRLIQHSDPVWLVRIVKLRGFVLVLP